MFRRSAQYLGCIGFGVVLAGCATTTTTASAPTAAAPLTPMARYIDARRIHRSGAATAWDAVRLLSPSLPVVEVGPLGTRRSPATSGSGSLGLSRPRLIVDGFPLPEPDALRAIPASDVIDIQLIGSLDAMLHFGSGYGGGAIVIRTVHGARRR